MTIAMELVVTLVAPSVLPPETVADLVAALRAHRADRLDKRAAELLAPGPMEPARTIVREALAGRDVDGFVQPRTGRAKRLLISDMDSTLIAQECIDELANAKGLKREVAAITERAMRGEIDFAAALRERVALLQGVPLSAVDALLSEVITISAGAARLIATCRAEGVRTVLVSGGFTHFAEPIAARLRIDEAHANRLLCEDDRLTGRVAEPILGPDAKRQRLCLTCEALGIDPADAVALGDGANDLAMLEAAGLGVAYKAKPAVREAADAAIDHTDLTSVLYAMGIAPSRFVD